MNKIFTFIFIFLLFSLGFVFAQSLEIDPSRNVEYSVEDGIYTFVPKEGKLEKLVLKYGDQKTIIEGSNGIEFDQSNNRIIFTGENSRACIDDFCYNNIVATTNNQSAFIELDPRTGDILEAEFFTTSSGGTYNFNGISLTYPGDTKVSFKKQEGLFLLSDSAIVGEIDPLF